MRRLVVVLAVLLGTLATGLVTAVPAGANPPTDCYASASTGSDANPGTLASPMATIQSCIGAVNPGATVYVEPGTYNHDEANGYDPATGGAGSNDFNIFVNKSVTIQGLDASLHPITSPPTGATAATAPVVSAERYVPDFGASVIFVQADNVTIQGLQISGVANDVDKTVEVSGNNVTFNANAVIPSGGGDLGIYAGPQSGSTTAQTTYAFTDNTFNGVNDGYGLPSGIQTANGSGATGPVSGRVISGNSFTNLDDGLSFAGEGAQPWLTAPVGTAAMTGNTFSSIGRRDLIAYGSPSYGIGVGYTPPDWCSFLSSNTFDKAAFLQTAAGGCSDTPRTWSSGTFGDIAGVYSSIQQYAINKAQPGDTIQVLPGTYDESLTIGEALTLRGANAGVAGTAARGAESTISTSNVTGNDYTVDVASPGVTVDGFTLQQTATVTCATCAAFGVQVEPNANGATVADNIITGMSTSGSSPAGAGNPIGVDVGANATASPSSVTIARNLIESISSTGTQHRSALGIEVGDSTSHPVGTGLVIADNHITGVSSAAWGGYGVIANRPTTGTQISGNTIDTVYGGAWSRGVGLESVETGASVANNAISGITTGNPSPGAADDVYVDATDTGAGSTTVADNSLAGTATTAGVLNLATGTVSATHDWWGCAGGPGSAGCSGVSGPVTIFPGIYAYTADPTKAGQPGFWPTAVSLWTNTSTITSAPSVQIAAGKAIKFTVTTHGNPAATVSATGLPAWATLTPGTGSHAGTAKLTGTGPLGGGDFSFTIHATNGTGPDATQTFTVHVLAFSSLASVNFSKSGPPTQSFTVTTTGGEAGVILSATLTGNEAGLTFHDIGNGTATLSGVPVAPAKTHLVKITAKSGAATVTQQLAVGISA